MTIGPGKYDDLCTRVREAQALAAFVIIIGGTRGDGFSCQANVDMTAMLPDLLESVAREIRANLQRRES